MTVDLRVVQQAVTPESLEAYATVAATSAVASRLNVPALLDPTGPRFVEEQMTQPRVLESDLYEGEDWEARGDLDRWIMLCAFAGPERVGGALVAIQPEDDWFFPPEPGLAVLRDIRVVDRYRRQGIARRLVQAAAAAAAGAGCDRLAIETQDVNVAACRVYASCGAVLQEARQGAYGEYSDDVALLWYLEL